MQVNNKVTCMVPEFVHSLAAQLFQVPMLKAYKEFLIENPNRLVKISIGRRKKCLLQYHIHSPSCI